MRTIVTNAAENQTLISRRGKEGVADITVIIPVKDRYAELISTLKSVYSQTLLPSSIIIVDDFSQPPITFERLPPPPAPCELVLINNEKNIGGSASLNRGLFAAKTLLVSFLDSDDCFLPNYIDVVNKFYHSRKDNTTCVVTGFYWCLNDLRPYRIQLPPENISFEDLATMGNVAGGNSVVTINREVFCGIGGFPKIRVSYDWAGLLAISKVGRISTIKRPLVYYRSPSASKLHNYTKSHRKQILAKAAIIRSLPEQFRASARQNLLEYACLSLANAGRYKLSRRLLTFSLKNGGIRRTPTQRAIIVNIFGYRPMSLALFLFAHLRATYFRTNGNSD